ncbi:MAG: hypothetical protein OHK0057_27590 [Thermoflexibacter sp.]
MKSSLSSKERNFSSLQSSENQRKGVSQNAPSSNIFAPSQMKKDSATGSGIDLPAQLKTQMESSMNADFTGVKIHTNSSEAKQMGAKAFARGNNIHFAQGYYNPDSQKGKEMLGHELAHILQQRQGKVKPTGTSGGYAVNTDDSLENQADNIGKKAANAKI